MKTERKKTSRRQVKRRSNAAYHLMMFPGLFFLILFSYIPMVGILMAFQDFVPAKGLFGSDFVGLKHFIYMIHLPDIGKIIRNTLVIALGKILLGTVMAIAFSILLNEIRIKFLKKTVQTVVYLPHFLSWVVLGGILVDILSPTSGIVNTAITALGHEPVFFLGSLETIRGTLVASDVWKGCGYNMVIFLAALTAIDQSQYEAAKVDGAGYFKQMLYITLPGILPQIILVTVLGMGNILNAGFDQVFNLYSPIVYQKADILDTYVYRLGMLNLQYSVSTAVGLFKSVISFILIASSFTLAKKFANYRIF